MDNIVFRYEDIITPEHCSLISNYILEKTKDVTPNFSMENNIMPWHYEDRVIWKNIDNVNIKNLVSHYRLAITQLVAFSYKEIVYPNFTDLVRWRSGTQQDEHVDSTYFPERVYTSIAYLTDNFIGGETFIKNNGGEYHSVPTAGTVIILPSDERAPHGVCEVIGGDRITLAMWFADEIDNAEDYF